MNATVLVDTDILIDVARGNETAIRFLEQAELQASLAVSVITEMELIIGCRNKRELRGMDTFLKRFIVAPLAPEISAMGSSLLRKYRLSHGLLIADALIAATASILSIPFATKNVRDFGFIDGLLLSPYPSR